MKVPRLTEPNPVKCIFTQESSCFSCTENNTFFPFFFWKSRKHPFPKKEKKYCFRCNQKHSGVISVFRIFLTSGWRAIFADRPGSGIFKLRQGYWQTHRDWATWGFKVHGSFVGTCDECPGPDITSNLCQMLQKNTTSYVGLFHFHFILHCLYVCCIEWAVLPDPPHSQLEFFIYCVDYQCCTCALAILKWLIFCKQINL